ncbi:MAG TPA: ribosomal protein S18-alanine N-acetyltransferase [Clostridia bacterium]|nr:ribosomal protein S18-alanine N-acetyltransferase [Clostridia bacterium]
MEMTYLLRAMKEEDISQVVEIEKQSFSSPWSAYAFKCELADNDFAYYLVVTTAENLEQVLGYGGIWVIIDEAHITNIAIAPEYRGKNLGELLLKGLEVIAIENGAVRMTLEVRVSNEKAKALYSRRGFVPAGIRPHYYVDGNEDALIMWKEFF